MSKKRRSKGGVHNRTKRKSGSLRSRSGHGSPIGCENALGKFKTKQELKLLKLQGCDLDKSSQRRWGGLGRGH